MRYRLEDKSREMQTFGRKVVWIAVILAASLITGCEVGPNYHRPKVQVPTTFRAPNQTQQAEAQAASFADLPWWKVFRRTFPFVAGGNFCGTA